jgi:hypothetical protein
MYRLHLLTALCTVDDKPTQLAASGALATLTMSPRVVRAIIEQDRGVAILLELLNDDDRGLQHRGLEALKNIVCSSGQTLPEQMKGKVKGVLESLSKEASVIGATARDALAALN